MYHTGSALLAAHSSIRVRLVFSHAYIGYSIATQRRLPLLSHMFIPPRHHLALHKAVSAHWPPVDRDSCTWTRVPSLAPPRVGQNNPELRRKVVSLRSELILLPVCLPLSNNNTSKMSSDDQAVSEDSFEFIETPAAPSPAPETSSYGVRTTSVGLSSHLFTFTLYTRNGSTNDN